MTYRPPPIGPKQLEVTGPARYDIDDALGYIARTAGTDVALRFADRIDAELSRLAELGHGGAPRDWLSPGLRFTTIARYSVYFRVTETALIVVRFLHGARDLSGIGFDPED